MSNRTAHAGLTIERAGADEASFAEVFDLTLALHKQGGFARMDYEKTAAAVYSTLKDGIVFVARNERREAIGTLGLSEQRFWYSQDTFLQDAWVYVRPAYRKGGVGVALMRAARDEAQRRGKICFITVHNPDRRSKKTAMSLESQTAGFVPLGYTIKLN